MTMTQIKQAWIAWQVANEAAAARLRQRFATKAIEHGFVKAQRYLTTAIAERLHVPWHDVAQALK